MFTLTQHYYCYLLLLFIYLLVFVIIFISTYQSASVVCFVINVRCACVQSTSSYSVVSHIFDFIGYVCESLRQCHRNSIILGVFNLCKVTLNFRFVCHVCPRAVC